MTWMLMKVRQLRQSLSQKQQVPADCCWVVLAAHVAKLQTPPCLCPELPCQPHDYWAEVFVDSDVQDTELWGMKVQPASRSGKEHICEASGLEWAEVKLQVTSLEPCSIIGWTLIAQIIIQCEPSLVSCQ